MPYDLCSKIKCMDRKMKDKKDEDGLQQVAALFLCMLGPKYT